MMRRLACALALVTLLAPASAAEASHGDRMIERTLDRSMDRAGRHSGAFVLDVTDRDVLFRRRDRSYRIMASNTKLFTTAALLARQGADDAIETVVLGHGQLELDGTWRGDLYLRGGGDPGFGRDHVERLAEQLAGTVGIRRVSGRVVGDESAFDSRRGTAKYAYRASGEIGAPLSALSFEGSRWHESPAEYAARRLGDALEDRGVRVRGRPRAGEVPAEATRLAAVESAPLGDLVRITNTYSSNFYAEMLLKVRGAASGLEGTTARGARATTRFARRLGGRRVRIADGSGLSWRDRAAPRAVAELLDEMRDRPEFDAFYESLARPGRDGTLRKRMRRGHARRRCRAKTGTLSNVSALSGYCRARSGDTIVFSFLMNRVSPSAAKRLEDRMVEAIARYG